MKEKKRNIYLLTDEVITEAHKSLRNLTDKHSTMSYYKLYRALKQFPTCVFNGYTIRKIVLYL